MHITITNPYQLGEAIFEDEDFYEEVIAQVEADSFLLTCSLGIDDDGEYINWNLFYNDFFSGSETIPLHKCNFNVFDEDAFTNEIHTQIRRMLMKAANSDEQDAIAAKQLLAHL